MTVERERDSITFVCDECDDEFVSTGVLDFSDAWEEAREEGWHAIKNINGTWSHTCDICSE